MTDDPTMVAVVTASVELPPRRVCEGFRQEAWLAVFNTISPCVMVCMHKNGRHYHLYLGAETSKNYSRTVALGALEPEALVEHVLENMFDKLSPEQQAVYELTKED